MSDRRHDDELLAELVARFKESTPPAPDGLEERILRAVRVEHEATTRAPATVPRRGEREDGDALPWYLPAAWPRPVWAGVGALAALLVVAALFAVRAAGVASAPAQADRLLVADALRDAESAERQHAEAIARLQQAARPVLARASDPQLAGEHAAHLMMLSNRLRFLDQTIDEIQSYVRDNPAHSGARTTLLAAYTEKTEVLRDVIALAEEISS